MNTTGKSLTDLIYDVDVLRKAVKTVLDDHACICWQKDGTLTYFTYEDGYPGCYYAPHTDFANNREDFTSFERFLAFMRTCFSGEHMRYLLTAPVWEAFSPPLDTQAFNALLGDMEIDL